MNKQQPHVRLCDSGRGWCVENLFEVYGPLDSEDEANRYALLIRRVLAARTQIACTDDPCWQ